MTPNHLIVYFEVDLFPLSTLQNEIKENDKNYTLFCITYRNGGHFVGCVNVPKNGWYM